MCHVIQISKLVQPRPVACAPQKNWNHIVTPPVGGVRTRGGIRVPPVYSSTLDPKQPTGRIHDEDHQRAQALLPYPAPAAESLARSENPVPTIGVFSLSRSSRSSWKASA